jgi:hypothetical protein
MSGDSDGQWPVSLPRSPMPSRTQPLARTNGLARYAARARGSGLQRRTPLRQVSAQREAENRARKAMIARLYPERPLCAVPECFEWADDRTQPLCHRHQTSPPAR